MTVHLEIVRVRYHAFSQTCRFGLQPIDKDVDLSSSRVLRAYDISILARQEAPWCQEMGYSACAQLAATLHGATLTHPSQETICTRSILPASIFP